jgi:hypothetical protein
MPVLSKHVVWDAPPFLLSRKGSVRVSAYLFNFIGKRRFVPSLVQVRLGWREFVCVLGERCMALGLCMWWGARI